MGGADNPEVLGAFRGDVSRRGSPRAGVIAEAIILVDVAPLNTAALLIDLSEDGLALQFALPVSQASNIQVRFSLDENCITASCEIVWSLATTWGLRFIDLSQEAKAIIRNWLQLTILSVAPASGNDALPATELCLPEVARLVNDAAWIPASPTRNSAELTINGNTPEPTLESAAGTSCLASHSNEPDFHEGGANDWVARMMTRQKQERAQRWSSSRRDDDEGVATQVQQALPTPAQRPERTQWDTAILELRTGTAAVSGPVTSGTGLVARERRRKLHQLSQTLSAAIGLAVIVLFGAVAGFMYATRIPPPIAAPPPSSEFGFGGVHAGQRLSLSAVPNGSRRPRTSRDFLALGDRSVQDADGARSCAAAVEYFRAAAMLGHPGALERLATLYSTGECVSVDRVQAYRVFQQALTRDPNLWVEWNLIALWERMTAAERTQLSPPQGR